MLLALHYSKVKYLMAKNSFYKNLVRQFESTINNYPTVNSELDFTKLENIILNKKKDNRYYRGIQQFLVYLRKCKDKDELIFISNESEKECQCASEKVESLLVKQLEEKARLSAEATVVKKSNLKSLAIQPFLTMFSFLQLFTGQIISARPLEVRRFARQTNNHEYQNNDQYKQSLGYQDDLQKSKGFSRILNQKQPIKFEFKYSIFTLTKESITRQDPAGHAESLNLGDYQWFLKSLAIFQIENKVRKEAQNQGLILNKPDVEQITRELCRIEAPEQIDRKLLRTYSKGDIIEKISESKFEKFIFNAIWLPGEFKAIFSRGNNNNLVSDVDKAVSLKITALKNSQQKTEIGFASHFNSDNSQALPENHSIISNATSSISNRSVDQSAEGFNWKITASAAGGAGIILLAAIIFWYRKKNRSATSGLATEQIPLLNSIPDSLHVLKIAGQLDKRLKSLKHLKRYDSEIEKHYISFKEAKNKEKAIKDLKKIQEILTKYSESKKSSDKDRITSNKLKSALLIVESLMQRYYLLSWTDPLSKNNYITTQQKSGLKDARDLLLKRIEIVSTSLEKKEAYNLEIFTSLLEVEKVCYDATLSAHIEGYFENYKRNEVLNCLNLKFNNEPMVNNEIPWENLLKLQEDLGSTVKIILDLIRALSEKLSESKDKELSNAIKPCITKFECMKSQLTNYSGYCKGRWEQASKLQKQTQASAENSNSTIPKPLREAASQYLKQKQVSAERGNLTIFKPSKLTQNSKVTREFTI